MKNTLARKIPLSVRRKAVSIHEAGHIVVAIILKRNVSHAVLYKPHGKSGKTFIDESALSLDLNSDKSHQIAENYIVAALAGQIAEGHFWTHSAVSYKPKIDTQIHDDAEIDQIREALAYGPDEDAKYMQHCRDKTNQIVLDPRCQAAINAISVVLCRDFIINRSDIDVIMRRHGVL